MESVRWRLKNRILYFSWIGKGEEEGLTERGIWREGIKLVSWKDTRWEVVCGRREFVVVEVRGSSLYISFFLNERIVVF